MMIKFLARGTGSARAAADYLTREQNLAPEQDQDQDRDPEKNPKEIKVLRGHPRQVADVADALQFEHKYTSGVALLHDSTAARVGALFQLLVQGTTAQDFGLPSSAIRLRM